MKDPSFNRNLLRLLCGGWMVFAGLVLAQSPENGPVKRPAPRAKPQVIYHLSRSSNYAASLHSQAKSQNSEMQDDDGGPVSLQMSRATPTPLPAPPSAAASGPERQMKPKVRSNRSQPRSFAKPPGHGNGHGNKSRKK